MLAARADINVRTKENVTPLITSLDMACGKPEISLALIRAGADVNVVESDGDTALWIATTESSLEVMKELLSKGANPNVQARGGDTPLHLAASNGLPDRAELLLQYGATTTIRNTQGQTPLEIVTQKSPETTDILNKYSHRQ